MPYPIKGTEALQLSQMITGQALLQNTGDSTVYMGPDTSVTSLNYELSLPPGATVNWEGGDLFAICAATETSAIGIKYGANTSITPGPSTVTSVGQADVLYAVSGPLPSGIKDLTNVGKYDFVVVSWSANNGGYNATPRAMFLSWYTPNPPGANILVDSDSVLYVDSNAGAPVTVIRAVKSDVLRLDWASTIQNLTVLGINSSNLSESYTNAGTQSPGVGYTYLGKVAQMAFGAIGPSTSALSYPSTRSGRAQLVMVGSAVTNTGFGLLAIVEAADGAGAPIGLFILSDANFVKALNELFYLPTIPIRLRIANLTTVAQTVSATITYLD